MKIPLKAKVICKDGEFGSVRDLLIDPVQEKVSHVVVENKHKGEQVIIPTEKFDYSTDAVLNLEYTAAELEKYPPFLIQEFISIPVKDTDFAYWGADPTMTHSYTMFPYVMHEGNPSVEITKEVIPKGELKLRRGMVVKDCDGKSMGHIDELIIEPTDDFITHIVMRTGHLFGKKEVAVPNIHIASFEKDAVILSISSDQIDNLPEVIIKRSWK